MNRGGERSQSHQVPPKYTARRLAEEQDTVEALTGMIQTAEPPLAYWASPDGSEYLATGSVKEIAVPHTTGIGRIKSKADEIFQNIEFDGPEIARPRFIGVLRFDDRDTDDPAWDGFPEHWFLLPQQLFTRTPTGTWLTSTDLCADDTKNSTAGIEQTTLPEVIDYSVEPDRDTWVTLVESIIDAINDERVTKAVLGNRRQLSLTESVNPGVLAKILREKNPGCFVSILQPGTDAYFATATPERLVSRSKTTVHSSALAGSLPRGADQSSDSKLSAELQGSSKNAHEHGLVVDSIASRLRQTGGLVTVGDRSVRRFRSVQHLHTPIKATYDQVPHVLDIVDELHPTPAVGGSPRDAALMSIQESEPFDRRWYAAPLGWFDADGNGEFAIGIRSAVVSGKSLTAYAGAGIVAESDPIEEWNELQWKYEPICSLFPQHQS